MVSKNLNPENFPLISKLPVLRAIRAKLLSAAAKNRNPEGGHTSGRRELESTMGVVVAPGLFHYLNSNRD